MGQEDFLKIILEATLDKDSLQDIKDKLELLKNSVDDIKIKIVADGNFAKIVENLSKNLEALNQNLSKLTEKQLKALREVGEQSKKNANETQEQQEKQKKNNEKIKRQEEDLLRNKIKYNEAGKPVQQTKVYAEGGDRNKKRTVTTDLETGDEIGNSLDIANEKIRKANEKRKELIKEYAQTREKFVKELNKMEKAGASKGATDPLRANLKENFRQKEIFGTEKNPNENYEKDYKNALAETNRVLNKSIEYQKNLNKVREVQKDMAERRDALKDQGYDVEGINKLMQSQLQASKTTQELNEGIRQINKELSSMESTSKTFNKLEEQARKLGITIDKSFKNIGDGSDLTEFQTKIANVQALINAKKEQANATTRVEIQQMERLLAQLNQEYQERNRIAQEENRLTQHRNKIAGDKIEDSRFGADRVSQNFESSLYSERAEGSRELARQFVEANRGAINLSTAYSDLTRTVDALGNEQMRVSYTYADTNGEMQRATVVIDQATGAMYDLGNATTSAGHSASSSNTVLDNFANTLARVPQYLASFGLVYGAFNQLENGLRILYEVDDAMTNLAKVTTATTSQMEQFRLEASQIGQELGATTVDVAKAVTEFQKLGYTFEQSKGLGETALIYSNVGDMGIDEANESMVSSLKGFGVANEEVVNESVRYLDIFNEVGNRFAVSSAGIGEALKRSSAALYEAGNDVEQSVAMITAANAVIQDEKKVGTAMKTISMRLRGMDEETGKVTKSVPEVANQFKAAGVEVMASATQFKSTYEIMDDLAKNWKNLSDTQQAALIETIGGKYHGTVVSSMLNNWKDATDSLAVAQGSAGSSAREFAKYQESLVYRVDRLKASYEEFWLTFWDDGAIKDVVDGLNSTLNALTSFINKLGALSLISAVITPAVLLLNKTLRTTFMMSAVDIQQWATATNVAGNAMTRLQRATMMATVAVRALGKAMIVGIAISAGIAIISKLWDKATGSSKKYLDSLQEQYDKQTELISQLDSVDLMRYGELEDKKNAGTINTTELQEYLALQEQLKNSGQDVISHYEDGNAILMSADALKNLNSERRKEIDLIREKKTEEEKKKAKGETGARGLFFNNPMDKKILDVAGFDTDYDKFDEAVQSAEKNRDKLTSIKKEMEGLDLVKDIISSSDLSTFKTNNSAFQEETNKVLTSLDKLKNNKQITDDVYNKARTAILNFSPDKSGANFKDLQFDLSQLGIDIQNQSKDVEGKLNEAEAGIDSSLVNLKQILEDDFNRFLSAEDIDLASDAGEVAKMLDEAYADSLEKGQFEKTGKAIDDKKTNLMEAFEAIQDAGIDLGELAKGSPEAIAALEKLGLTMSDNAYVATLMGNAVAIANGQISASQGEQVAETSVLTEQRAALNAVMADYDSKATVLAETLKMVNDGESLSTEQINNLLTLYPQLNGQMTDTNGILGFKQEALIGVMKTLETQSKSEMDNIYTIAENRLKVVNKEIEGQMAKIKASDAYMKAALSNDEMVIASAAAAASATARQSIYAKNAKLDPVAQLSDREIESRANSAGQVAYNQIKALQKLTNERSGLEGFLGLLSGLKQKDLTRGKINEVDPPEKPKAPKKDSGGADKTKEETENLVYITDEYKNVLRELNMQIAANRELMENYPSYSKDYQEGLKREIGLIGKKLKATEDEEKSLENQIASRKLKKTGLIDLNKEGGGGGGTSYTVKRGDTLSAIAKKFDTNYQAIAKANNIANANRISIGQKLNIGGTGGGGGGGGGVNRNLRYGSRGEDVKALQRKLGITADGIFGSQTASAVRSYQKSHGLGVDAIAGIKTLGSMGLWGAGGGGDTPQNAQAKLEEELDKARDELEQLQQARIALRKEANDLTLELIESEVARLDRESKLLGDDLANVDFLSVKLDENSEAWRKNRGERLELLNTQATNYADSIEFLDNEIKTAENILNEKMNDQVYDMLQEQKTKYLELQQQIYEENQAVAESVINEIVENYERDFSNLDRQMNKLTNIASKVSEGDLDKYYLAQEEILKVLKNQMTLTDERLKQLEAEEELVKDYPELYKDWKEQVIELQDAQEELNQTLWETQKDLLDSHEGAIDELVDLFSDYYEKRQDMELDSIDEIIDKEEELADKKIENYEKDYDAFEENINKQMEALDKAENDRAYAKDLGDKKKSAQDIMDMIGLVSIDTSPQGRQRLRQLQDELKTVTDEISEMQTQRRLENRQEALQKELEARAEETDKISEAEENRLDAETERLEKHTEEVERKWENLINNERLFAQMREDLLAGNIESMSSQIDSFVKIISDSSTEMGESLSQNLIDNFINARKELLELDKALTDSQIDFNAEYGSNANRVTTDMINNIPMANPLNSITLSNPNNIPTGQNPISNNQVVNLTVNIDTVQGGEDGADEFINAVTNGLARKGVTI